ncbi:TetR/AcrR family transcriptional regulator [Planctomicrobium sp. SH668]|uniref:TetR/AcrR family transcriptional regulator n=1 Tax=Planctomicrobium sp. SH668 TaxID=3448126 RepID=UPI003F5C5A68
MGTTSRKQREISNREQMLLTVARGMFIEQGFAGLSLDRLAEATEYSKGTIYQHFSSKEDLVAALAIQSSEMRVELFAKAARFQGQNREGASRQKLMALFAADETFAQHHSHYFRSEMIVRMANIEEKVTSERRERLQQLEQQALQFALEPIRHAIDGGELKLPAGWKPEQIAFSLFSLVFGANFALLNYTTLMRQIGITSRMPHLLNNFNLFLDGLNWAPLSTEFDYSTFVHTMIYKVLADDESVGNF